VKLEPGLGARLLAALSYCSILFLIPLVLVDEDNQFGAFHIRHGFMLFVLTIIGNVVLLLIDIVAQGWVYPYAGRLFNIIIVVFCLYGIFNALSGRMRPMWVVSSLLERFPL